MENVQGNNSRDTHVESGEPATHNWVSVPAEDGADNEYIIYSQPIGEPIPPQPAINYHLFIPYREPDLAGAPTLVCDVEVICSVVEHDPSPCHDANTGRLISVGELQEHTEHLRISTPEPYDTRHGKEPEPEPENTDFSSPGPSIDLHTNIVIRQTFDPAGTEHSSTMSSPPSFSFTLRPENPLPRGEGAEKQSQGHGNISDSNSATTSSDGHYHDDDDDDELNWAGACLPRDSVLTAGRQRRVLRFSPYRSSPLHQVTLSWEQQAGARHPRRRRHRHHQYHPYPGRDRAAKRTEPRQRSPELGYESGYAAVAAAAEKKEEEEEKEEKEECRDSIPTTATIPDTDDEDGDEDEENEGSSGAVDAPVSRAGGSDRVPLRARVVEVEAEAQTHARTDAEN